MDSIPWTSLWLSTGIALAVLTAGHALLNRPDPRTAWGWIAVCWLFPFAGPVLYYLFGINRLQTRARRLGRRLQHPGQSVEPPPHGNCVSRIDPALHQIVRTADTLTGQPLLGGNQIEPLEDGEQAYPRMLEAIAQATHSVWLATYIFDDDPLGRQFVDALAQATQRGVEVRVLVDGFGAHYSRRRISRLLERRGVPCALFNPLRLIPPSLHLNLRNHRKLLLVDGRIGFTGGMNLSARHLVHSTTVRHRVRDLHFVVHGPVLAQLATLFSEDWYSAVGALLPPPPVPLDATPAGTAICRAIADGPNETRDHIGLVLQAAISAARRKVRIMTPYFLPPANLLAELQSAALRGVEVSIVIPARNNLPFVAWAMRHTLPQLLQFGLQVHEQPGLFCHSKLFSIDGEYAQIGSANLDARSLKLNFELAVEIHDAASVARIDAYFERALGGARAVTLAQLRGLSLPKRVRNAVCWLFSPYL